MRIFGKVLTILDAKIEILKIKDVCCCFEVI
jgi:hypothetical protein